MFFDTTVLVAAYQRSDPHYAQAWPALLRVAAGQDKGFMGQHSIAELFAALTRLPVHPSINPVEAARIVTDKFCRILSVSLGKEDYVEELNTISNGGWNGAKICDALQLRCAASCAAERVYSFNLGVLIDAADEWV
jgi:predicted nucleic acid-binding protein